LPVLNSAKPEARRYDRKPEACATTAGGVVTSLVMELAVYPAIYFLWRSRQIKPSSDD